MPELRAFGGDEEGEFVKGARPVFAEETGEGAVGEEFASGLAGGAVVGFVAGVADALDFCAATRARLFIAAVDGHAFAERSDFFRKFAGGVGAEAIRPAREARADGVVETLDFGGREFLGKRERREFSFPKNFVGVGVADAAEDARVGQEALERVIGGDERGGEMSEVGGEDFEAAGIKRAQTVFTGDDVERGTFFGAGFSPEQGTVGEVEGGETARWSHLGPRGTVCGRSLERVPVKAAGDH